MQRLLKAAANTHNLAYGLHLQAEAAVSAFKLVKIPARNFHDHIVKRRLKVGRRGLGDLVVELVERVANRQLRRDFGNGVARSLRGQRRRARHPRIDLNRDNILLLVRAHCELYVASAGEVSDRAHHLNRHVAHALVGGV